MATPFWNILVVDDEKDVHDITHLALKRRSWRRRNFELTSCFSGKEARELLTREAKNRFQVAIVDVVMETQTAGLELCRFIRSELPVSVRIILRTGQPGVAPEESVINDFDIDYYMSKPEVTPEKLFATVRSCLRSSQDIDTLIAFSRQLRRFTSALQTITTEEDLAVFMNEGLRFLELKHQVRITFTKSIDDSTSDLDEVAERAAAAVHRGHGENMELAKLVPANTVGLETGYLLLFAVQVEGSDHVVRGGFLVEDIPSGLMLHALQGDLTLFMQNWTIAHGALLLQQRIAREKMLNERMYIERIESIANMVTGIAHEINTPLGVANTANGMIVSLVDEVRRAPPGPHLDELVADLKESSGLLTKNLERASRLIRSFKQLSASQLSDERTTADLGAIIKDCIETMSVETRKAGIKVTTDWPVAGDFAWVGFPGHLSQVLINMIQNTLRHAYKGGAGTVDIRLRDDGERFLIEFEDYGAGVPEEIFPRMFEPFITSARAYGGTGLGLAITHNIVVNLLKGQITCTSKPGQGTKFAVNVPKVVPA